MESTGNKFPNSLIWIAGIAIIVFCATGVAAIMGWIPTSIGYGNDDVPVVNSAGPQTKAQPSSKTAQRTSPQSRVTAAPAASTVPAHRRCDECGVIASIQRIESRGQGSGVGAIGGGLLGGVLGHQVGGGRGKDLATVVGAVGGVVAGNEIEKRMQTTTGYDVTVRLYDGSSRTIRETDPPMWRNGDDVKIVAGVIHPN